MADTPGISFVELLEYVQEQTEGWRALFLRHPFLLNVDATPTSTVADLLFHIFTTEYHIAQRLVGETMRKDEDFARRTVSDLFSIGESARLKMREYLAQTDGEEVNRVRTFPSPTLGEFQATPKKMLTHAIVHGIRHWAQIARVVRENGHRAEFSHDVLFSKRIV